MASKLDYVIIDLLDSTAKNLKAHPLNLGGISGVGGGVGGPPGGFIGWLPQTRVAYDEDEFATLDTPSLSGIPSGVASLLDNLNHIRYRLNILESGGSIIVMDDNTPDTFYDVDTIHFSGAGVVVTDLGFGDVRVTISATGSGGGGGISDAPADGEYYVRRNNAWSNADNIFEGGVVINDAGGDFDTRIEGDTDANLIFADASAGRVGIGTNVPAQKLDVVGVIESDGANIDGAGTFNEAGADVNFRVEGDNDINLLFLKASNDRVGIGTNGPAAKLHVEGDVIINDLGADKDVRIEGDTDANLVFTDASTDRVGVGTSTPGYKLDVAGDINISSGSVYRINGVALREELVANRTYYVRTDGSDSNTGLVDSSGGAFLTIQKAVNVTASLDMSIYDVTIQIRTGTYAEQVTLKQCVGAGTVFILGDTSTPANIVVSGSTAFTSDGIRTLYNIQGIKGTGAGNFILASNSALVDFGNVNIANTGQQLRCADNATIRGVANYTISASATHHWVAVGGGVIRIQSKTITLTGTPAFSSQFAGFDVVGKGFVNGNTFSGSATGTRYLLNSNSVLSTGGGGANYLPGNVAGSVATGGQYL